MKIQPNHICLTSLGNWVRRHCHGKSVPPPGLCSWLTEIIPARDFLALGELLFHGLVSKGLTEAGIHPHSRLQVPCPLFLFPPLHLQAITVLFTLGQNPGKPFSPALKKLLPACTQAPSAQHPATPLSPDPPGEPPLAQVRPAICLLLVRGRAGNAPRTRVPPLGTLREAPGHGNGAREPPSKPDLFFLSCAALPSRRAGNLKK